jgi:hypothetical protein
VHDDFLNLSEMDAPLRKMSPAQCLLKTPAAFLKLRDRSMLIANFYLRLDKPVKQQSKEELSAQMLTMVNAHTWLANVTMQGDGDGIADCAFCGIQAVGGRTHIEGMQYNLACNPQNCCDKSHHAAT